MNVLIAGIPLPELVACIENRYAKGLTFFVCESRPFEVQVAEAIARLQKTDTHVILLTDNMMDALFRTHPIKEVWSLYTVADAKTVTAINGAHTAALLSQVHHIPFYLYPIDRLPDVATGQLASESITVPCASYMDYAPDTFSRHLAAEVIEHK